MATVTDIVNIAMDHLGETSIGNIDDIGQSDPGFPAVRVAKRRYLDAVEHVLGQRPWPQALETRTLTRDAAPQVEPGQDLKNYFRVPNDMVKIVQVGDNSIEFERRKGPGKGYIAVKSEGPIKVLGTVIIDPDQMGGALREAVGSRLAVMCAIKQAESQTKRQKLEEIALMDYRAAATMAAGERGPSRPLERSRWRESML